jgi:precorrin-6Y C5,15-methyltransferase (decarboxylating)
MENKLYVIGIGYRPLDKRAVNLIINAPVILASKRLFDVFARYEEFQIVKERVRVINNIDETVSFIKANLTQPAVLLASGDPLFFGIGKRLIEEFGRDKVEIIPDLSSIQLAFSRIKETWDDAFFMSLHGGPDPGKRRRLPYEIRDIPSLIKRHNKIAILTDKENNPSKIALSLSSAFNLKHVALKLYVCERLGYPDERITEGTPEEIASMTFSDPNVVIIKAEVSKDISSTPIFGFNEEELSHSKGLITKDEVRAISIHRLRLPRKGIVWDIGAGSGSVSVEIAGLSPALYVFAIERDELQLSHIRENIERLGVANVEVIKGEAPEVLEGLPLPDRVFIGGSGGRLEEIMERVSNINAGIIVINATTLETLNTAIKRLKRYGYRVSVSEVIVARSKPLSESTHLEALNPVFVISGVRI